MTLTIATKDDHNHCHHNHDHHSETISTMTKEKFRIVISERFWTVLLLKMHLSN